MAAIRLTRTHRILIGIVVAGAVVIAGIGFAGSYAAVRALAVDKGFGWFANVFPIGVDAGIVVLLALDLLLTWMRIPFPLLRQTAWLLTAATIAFNGAAAWPDPLGVGMHGIIPVLFVVSVEAARHAIGRIADITADKHMESVRITRWLLAPLPTFRLWRRMKLWELRSYEEVIRREQDRLVYRARLRARYGIAWRRKAPVEAIMPLRLARYGVPLAETGDAGLEAAGIEIASPMRQLSPAAATAAPSPETETETVAEPVSAPAPAPAPASASGTVPAPGAGPQEQSHEHTYDQQLAYERQMHEQQTHFAVFQGAPHDSPWFAAQQQLQKEYYEEQQRQHAQTQPHSPGQPVQMVPSGAPGRSRPLGTVGVNGLNAVNGFAQANGVNGMNGMNVASAANGAVNGLSVRTNPGPGPHTEELPQPPFRPEPVAEEPESELLPDPAPEPASGLDLPDGIPVEEAYYAAYRQYVREHGDFPNARQFARFLPTLYGGTAPEERDLVTAIRDMRYRFVSETDTEQIP